MTRRLCRSLLISAFVFPGLFLSSCTPVKRESTGIDRPVDIAMPEIHQLYFTYLKAENKPPAKLADFDKLKQTWPRGYKAIQAGDIVVIWGMELSANTPIAYEKDTPEKGGLVLFGSGTSKRMTAEAFNWIRN
jgi:hypothetical protein